MENNNYISIIAKKNTDYGEQPFKVGQEVFFKYKDEPYRRLTKHELDMVLYHSNTIRVCGVLENDDTVCELAGAISHGTCKCLWTKIVSDNFQLLEVPNDIAVK